VKIVPLAVALVTALTSLACSRTPERAAPAAAPIAPNARVPPGSPDATFRAVRADTLRVGTVEASRVVVRDGNHSVEVLSREGTVGLLLSDSKRTRFLPVASLLKLAR
jgi:hypothetical protein